MVGLRLILDGVEQLIHPLQRNGQVFQIRLIHHKIVWIVRIENKPAGLGNRFQIHPTTCLPCEIGLVDIGPEVEPMIFTKRNSKRLGSIGRLPQKFKAVDIGLIDPPVEHDRVHPELAIDLRQLRNLAPRENVVGALHRAPESVRDAMPHQKIPDQRFAAHEECRRQGVPRPG